MTTSRTALENRRAAGLRSLRWLAVVLASLLLHLAAFQWAEKRIGLPSWHEPEEPVITTELLRPPVPRKIVPPQPHPVAVHHLHPSRPKPRPKPAAPPPIPLSQTMPLPGTSAEVAPSSDTDDDSSPFAPTGSSVEIPPVPQAPPAPSYRFDPPPSAELQYDVFALREQEKWYGSGKFLWDAAAGRYRILGEASITFFFKITVLNFRSEGTITDAGIAPSLYSETPFHKPTTETRFLHGAGDDGTISFSASNAIYPYHGGEQDRASIIWQLAGIGRGNPSQFVPGAQIDVFVAGTRDGETWPMQVVGLDRIESSYGKMSAWHVVRMPRPASHDQKIDIWLAPQHDWYPVKVRYTYADGDYLDLSLSDLTPASPQSASAR